MPQSTSMPRSQLRIAILSPLGRDGGVQHGGITPVIRKLTNRALARGIAVDLLLCSATTTEAPVGARVISLGLGNKAWQLMQLQAYLRKTAPDALLSAGMRANFLAAITARLGSKIRTVASLHNTLSRSFADKKIKRLLWSRLLRWPSDLVAVSAGVADDATKLFNIKRNTIHVIYNPVVTPDLYIRATESTGHPWFNDGGAPVLISVGRLEPQKDYATLINAFNKIITAGGNYRLIILGEGKLRSELDAQITKLAINERVCLQGFVSNPYSYMAAARLLVLSSRWEGLPTVLIEALALGCPVVATDCPSGPREILDNGRFGQLVPVGDADALANAITVELETIPDRVRLRTAAERFGVDAAGDHYLKLLLNLPPANPLTDSHQKT